MSSQKATKQSSIERMVPILLVLTIFLAFIIGILWQRVTNIEKNRQDATLGEEVVQQKDPKDITNNEMPEELIEKIIPVSEDDHIRGSLDAKVFLIEYSDFECPFCKSYHETIIQVLDKYDDLAWVYRQFPLEQLHSKAMEESYASECAFDQGGNEAFWKLADKIYEVTPSNDGLDLDKLPEYDEEVDLNGQALLDCIDSGKYKQKVDKHYQGGLDVGIRGTPATVVVNNEGRAWYFSGALGVELISEIIDEALASAS